MKHICLQENDYDCGLACIKMMLSHYHKNKEFLKLDKEKINAKCSLLELKRLAERYNLYLEGVSCEEKEEIFIHNNSMIQIQYQDLSHFIIFEKRRKNKVYLIDPKIGRIVVTIEYFLSIFTGFALIFKNVEQYELNKIEWNKINYKYVLLYITFLILDFGLLFLISYLGNNDKYLFHNFLIVLTLIISLFSKINIMNRHLKEIDNDIIEIINSEIRLNVSTKQGLLKYKVYTIKYLYGLINNIFIIIFLSFILFINGWYYLIIELIIGLLIFVIANITLIKNNTIINDINNLENKFYKENNVDNYLKLTDKSNYFSKKQTFTVVSYHFITISIGIILNNILQVNSFQYILFNVFYILLLIDKLLYLFRENPSIKLEYFKYCSSYNYLLKKIKKEENDK